MTVELVSRFVLPSCWMWLAEAGHSWSRLCRGAGGTCARVIVPRRSASSCARNMPFPDGDSDERLSGEVNSSMQTCLRSRSSASLASSIALGLAGQRACCCCCCCSCCCSCLCRSLIVGGHYSIPHATLEPLSPLPRAKWRHWHPWQFYFETQKNQPRIGMAAWWRRKFPDRGCATLDISMSPRHSQPHRGPTTNAFCVR